MLTCPRQAVRPTTSGAKNGGRSRRQLLHGRFGTAAAGGSGGDPDLGPGQYDAARSD